MPNGGLGHEWPAPNSCDRGEEVEEDVNLQNFVIIEFFLLRILIKLCELLNQIIIKNVIVSVYLF